MSAIITIKQVIGLGYQPGDWARLHGNGGSGAIDWNTPLSSRVWPLFPEGAGIYGFGHAPFGHHRFGHGVSKRTGGFGHSPFGCGPFGYGCVVLTATVAVAACGAYKFGFKIYDAAGNDQAGTPDEIEVIVHIAPPAPTGLKLVSYQKTTDLLILEAA